MVLGTTVPKRISPLSSGSKDKMSDSTRQCRIVTSILGVLRQNSSEESSKVRRGIPLRASKVLGYHVSCSLVGLPTTVVLNSL